MRASDDGTSVHVVSGQNVLRLGLSTYNSGNTIPGDFKISPSAYEVTFANPVHAFSFDYSGLGFSYLASSRGAYAIVNGIEFNLSHAAPLTAGFFGVVSSEAIKSFGLKWTANGSYAGALIDNFAVVRVNPATDPSAVPLPSSLALLLGPLAIGGIASLRRRRRRG